MLLHGAFVVTAEPGVSVFGEHVHVGATLRGAQPSLSRGAIVQHALRGSDGVVELRYHVVRAAGAESEPASVLRLASTLRVPLRASDDWGSDELERFDGTSPPYVLAFRCELPT